MRRSSQIMIFLVSVLAWSQSPEWKTDPSFSLTHVDFDKPNNIIVLLKEPSVAQEMKAQLAKGKSYSAEHIRHLRKRQAQQQDLVIESLAQRGLISGEKRRFKFLLNGFATSANHRDLSRIRAMPQVARVVEDEPLYAHGIAGPTSVDQINAPDVWALSDPSGQPVRGKGIRIAILDTGIDYHHPDLGGGFGPDYRVVLGYDFFNDDPDPMDDDGHGTHVAGIAAANGNFVGVAPEATLYAFKVLGNQGFGTTSATVAALEMAVDPDGDPATDDGAHVINLSLGSLGGVNSPSSLAADMAVTMGAVVVASAGNGGNNGQVSSPAIAPLAIAVASASGDRVDGFSSCIAIPSDILKPEIAAPGNQIHSTLPGGTYGANTGTSMSAPHIAGAAALIRQLQPQWDPARVKRFLVNRTDHLSPENFPCLGAGLINLAYVDDPRVFETDLPGAWYGRLDLNQASQSVTQDLRLYNVSDIPQTATPLNPGAVNGVSFQPGPAITIQPGSSGTVSQTLVFDTNAVPFSTDNDGNTLLNSQIQFDGGTLPFFHLYRKAFTLRVTGSTENDLRFMVFPDGAGQIQSQNMGPTGNLEFYLRPGNYSFLSVEFENQNQPKVWVRTGTLTFNLDGAPVQTISNLEREGFSPLQISIRDVDGQILTEEHYQRSYDLLRFNWKNSVDISFRFFSIASPTFAFDNQSDMATNLNGYLQRKGRHEYVGYNWFHDGENPTDFQVDLDLQDYQLLDWSYHGNSNATPEFVVIGFLGGINLLPINFQGGPGPNRVKTWEPIYSDISTLHPRQNIGRGFFVGGANFDASPIVTVSDRGTLTRLEFSAFSIRERETINTSRIAMRSLTGPATVVLETRLSQGTSRISTRGSTLFPITDGYGNLATDTSMHLSLELPDGQILESSSFQNLLGQLPDPNPSGDYHLKVDYTNHLRGEAVASTFEQRFPLINGVALNPVSIAGFTLLRDGAIVETVTGSENLYLELEGQVPPRLNIYFDRGNGWEETTYATTETTNHYLVEVPQPVFGNPMGLRIQASGPQTDSIELTIPRAFHTGFAKQLPWVVANDQFASRIALTHLGEEAVEVALIARDQSGSQESKTITLPARSVQSFDAAELFAMNGYNLTVIAPDDRVFPSFLTLTQRPGEAPSPAQTAGIPLANPSSILSFGNLEGDQIPAIVLSAPFQTDAEAQTVVDLTYQSSRHPPQSVAVSLRGASPFAATITDLFPDLVLAEDAWLTARSLNHNRIVGTLFGFNSQREPSMTEAIKHRQPGDLVFPWLVDNDRWESEISLINHHTDFGAEIEFLATSDQGETQSRTFGIFGGEVKTLAVEDLFPGLTRFSLTLRPNVDNVAAGLRTVNKNTPSGNSPARVAATQPFETAERILFGYLPGDQVPAVVIQAPWSGKDMPVRLTLLGENGALAEAQIQLNGAQPFAAVVADLFSVNPIPAHGAILAESLDGTPLTGTSFTFNQKGEPAMAKAIPLQQ